MTRNDRALQVIRDQGRGLEFLLIAGVGFISYIYTYRSVYPCIYVAVLYLTKPTQFNGGTATANILLTHALSLTSYWILKNDKTRLTVGRVKP